MALDTFQKKKFKALTSTKMTNMLLVHIYFVRRRYASQDIINFLWKTKRKAVLKIIDDFQENIE